MSAIANTGLVIFQQYMNLHCCNVLMKKKKHFTIPCYRDVGYVSVTWNGKVFFFFFIKTLMKWGQLILWLHSVNSESHSFIKGYCTLI